MRFFIVLVFLHFTHTTFSQRNQSVRGLIRSDLSLQAIEGVRISVLSDSSSFYFLSDERGQFSFALPNGRYLLAIDHPGFRSYKRELLVNSGKEQSLEILLVASPVTLDSVLVTSQPEVMMGEHSMSIEKSVRIAANFFDPVRMITSYPSVVTTNDQNNAIIVRGNSPNGLLWRLNGLDIVNPNHLANAGTLNDKPLASGGGVNILSAQVLDNTKFHSGSIPTNYGNLLSGVIDMSFRKGNSQKNEVTAQASLIGLDLAAEGPLNKGRKSSYLINYRYSTIGLLSQAGVDFGDESINFHDLSFNLDLPTKGQNGFSVFGFAGKSKNIFEAKDSIDREEDKDWYDINFNALTYGMGINYKGNLKGRIGLSYGISYSSSEQDRDTYFNRINNRYQRENYFAYQKIASGFFYVTGAVPNGRVSMGINASYKNDSLSDQSLSLFGIFNPCPTCLVATGPQGARNSFIVQPYWNWSMFLSSSLTMDVGFRVLYFSEIDYLTTEPRISFSYLLNNQSSLGFSFGQTNQQQQLAIALKGENLKPTLMNRYSLGYQRTWNTSWTLRSELFYQDIRDIPVDSTFSTFNYLNEEVPTNLRNIGKASVYGMEVMVEKLFTNRNYLLIGGSYYQSMYTDEYDNRFDSRFNGNYTFNFSYGKEWYKQSKQRVLGINTRMLYLGGLREAPVDYALSKVQYETIYDYRNGFSEKLKDYARLDFRISWTKNKTNYTRMIALDIQNLLSIENEAYHYYDFTKDKILTKKQLGIIPIIVYRIDF